MVKRTLVLAWLALLVVAGCSGGSTPSPTPRPTPSPLPTPGSARTLAELKYDLINGFGALWYCDPDSFPVPREDELSIARERWEEVVTDAEAYEAIADDLGLDPGGHVGDDEKLVVYRAWKVLNAIALDPIGNDTWRFDYLAMPAPGASEGVRTTGTITAGGDVDVEQQAPAGEPMCPICLAFDTRIDTPDGRAAVQDLRIGDPVWTVDVLGRRIAGTVVAIGSTAAPAGHEVVRLVLADGRTVTASPGHPLGDGRRLGDLRAGDAVDGSIVATAELVAYAGARTYDIVVSGRTGVYLVDGIALGSTLRP